MTKAEICRFELKKLDALGAALQREVLAAGISAASMKAQAKVFAQLEHMTALIPTILKSEP
jgi:hypothetical protein